MLVRVPASLWRENVIIIVLLLRVLDLVLIALLGSDVTPLTLSRQYPSQPRSQDLSSSSPHPGNEGSALPFESMGEVK